MTKDLEQFKANFNNLTLRQEFHSITGFEAKDKPEAFIGFINCLISSSVVSIIQNSHSQIMAELSRPQLGQKK